jgi:hypothetical protein
MAAPAPPRGVKKDALPQALDRGKSAGGRGKSGCGWRDWK